MEIPIDSTPKHSILVHLEEWFSTNRLQGDQTALVEKIFESPRSAASVVILKDPVPAAGKHIHTKCDEIILVWKGHGEMFIDGKWVQVKAGDFHICPRGVPHATWSIAGEELWMIGIFTPPQPKGGHDRIPFEE